jgi:hypothetical protein
MPGAYSGIATSAADQPLMGAQSARQLLPLTTTTARSCVPWTPVRVQRYCVDPLPAARSQWTVRVIWPAGLPFIWLEIARSSPVRLK